MVHSRISPLVLLIGSGCVAADTNMLEGPPDVAVAPTSRGLEACDAETHWRSGVSLYGWWPRAPRFSPDGTIVAHSAAIYLGGRSFHGIREGRTLGVAWEQTFDVDDRWRRHVTFEGNEIVVREGMTELLRVEADYVWSISPRAMITPDGGHLVAVSGRETMTLTAWSLDDGGSREVELGAFGVVGVETIDENRAFLFGLNRIAVVDFDAGIIADTTIGTNSEQGIIGATAHVESGRAGVTTRDGRLVVLGLSDLAVIETRRALVTRVNENIYAPMFEVSPVAWSADGKLFAHLDESGDIVVEGPEGELHRIEAELEPGEQRFSETPYLPGALAFSSDNERLAIAYEHDIVMFGCNDASQPDLTEGLPVEVGVPVEAKPHEVVEIAVDVPGYDGFRVARLEVDGKVAPTGTDRDTLQWSTGNVGTYDLRVVVDTGDRWGEARATVVVR